MFGPYSQNSLRKGRNVTFLFDNNNWTFDKLRIAEEACAEIAFKELKLDIYPNQIEIIGSDQMLEAYTSVGMPIMYDHWSFGEQYIHEERNYRAGKRGLAYEIVMNTSPCISLLMEENSMMMQLLVIAHAAFGHNHFFKNNYMFKDWTDADGIVDYLLFAKNYIQKQEEIHGTDTVRELLDALHAIQVYGVDRYKRPPRLNKEAEKERQKERAAHVQREANLLWSTIPQAVKSEAEDPYGRKKVPSEPQENLLYFIEKHSPILEEWQREVVRIVRKVSQYFHPQRQTKLMNEGFATSVHWYILNRMYDKGQISNGYMLEAIHSHAGVLFQPDYKHPGYSGYNPYALGFAMFRDMRKKAGEDEFVDVWLDAVENYKDDNFIRQFLSEEVVKEFGMMEITNEENSPYVEISGIQNRTDFDRIRETLADQYSLAAMYPDIEVINANVYGDRTLELNHTSYRGTRLDSHRRHQTLQYMAQLWGYPVSMQTTYPDGDVDREDTAY